MKMRKIFIPFVLLIVLLLNSCSSSKKSNSSAKSKSKSESHLTAAQKREFEWVFYNANKEKMLNNFPQATALFRKSLQLDPSCAACMFELANLNFVAGDYVNAEALSRSAYLLYPKNEFYHLLYINALNRNKKYNEELKEQQKLSDNYPDRLDFKYEMANRYLVFNKLDESLNTLNAIEKMTGITAQTSELKARVYIKQNKLDKAIVEIQNLIAANPTEVQHSILLADIYLNNNMPEKAYETYQNVLSQNPNEGYVHVLLSNYYGQRKQPDKAFEEMKLAFQNPTLDLGIKIKVLLPYYSNAEFNDTIKSQAYELLDLMGKAHPKESNAFSFHGDFYYRDKQYKEAKEKYATAVEIEKDKAAVWSQLLFTESNLNDYTSMQKDSKSAMELFPNDPIYFFFNGVANLQLNSYKESISSLKTGLGLVVDNKQLEGQFYANLGDAYYRDKQMGKSDSAYDKALEINPKDTYVLNNYSYYLSLRNVNLDKAETMSRKANELEPNNGNSQDTYAWILYATGKYNEAKDWIEKAILNGGEKNAVILEHYGDILFKLNEKNKALEYWIKAKEAGKGSDFLEKKIAEKTLFE
jgi:tetratricopeptide (TPR) repeat protein